MKLLLLVSLLFSSSIIASDRYQINELLDEIRDEVDHGQHDRRSLTRLDRQLRKALSTLQGGSVPPTPQMPSLLCIARDNDGRNPYVLGVRDSRTLRTDRVSRTNMGNLATCKRVIANAIIKRDMVLTCVTRDDDGKTPWAIALIKNGQVSKKLRAIGSLNDCIRTLSESLLTRRAMRTCTSRDDDGRSPFVTTVLDLNNGSSFKEGSFSSINSCLNDL